MNLLNVRKMAMMGVMGVGGLGLIGAGAHATFTQDTSSSQAITAGYLNVDLSASGATGNGTPNITLAPLGPVGSSFVSGAELITITNNGNVPVSEVALKVSDTNNNSTLQSETNVCFYSDGQLLVNEPLSTVEGYGAAVVGGSIAAGATDTYTAVFYAGATDAGCGAYFTGISGSSYTGYEGYSGTPAFGTNGTAPTLTNPAEGGTITPKITLSYQG
jgi:predicted ribosomally synthesized peptide with SipW-like signal peptide